MASRAPASARQGPLSDRCPGKERACADGSLAAAGLITRAFLMRPRPILLRAALSARDTSSWIFTRHDNGSSRTLEAPCPWCLPHDVPPSSSSTLTTYRPFPYCTTTPSPVAHLPYQMPSGCHNMSQTQTNIGPSWIQFHVPFSNIVSRLAEHAFIGPISAPSPITATSQALDLVYSTAVCTRRFPSLSGVRRATLME
jgi:hypothetical protein